METDSDIIRIHGGQPITGDIEVSGAKNSVLKLMAASILAPGQTCIQNVPVISDVILMGDVLQHLGADVGFLGSSLTIDSSGVDQIATPYELVVKMRASIAVLGPLLGRFNHAQVAMPGGCNIGSRKLDLHISALEALGVQFDLEDGVIIADAANGLHGASVYLDFPSVGATENLMMAAVKAKGQTTIENAAREPEIVDLADYLNAMGAQVYGAGTPVVEIHGVSELRPVARHRTVGDRIEAGTFLVAGALLGGPLRAVGVRPEHLQMALLKLEDMGIEVDRQDDAVTVARSRPIRPTSIQTLPYPGFPTDLQTQFMVLCCLASGQSMISENIFENRFQLVNELVRMGAQIDAQGHFAHIQGVPALFGAPVQATELRGGAALVLAGLVADGQTEITGLSHIDRGYEHLTKKLQALGADITRYTPEKKGADS
ncbi:MAG: UDP-N-acetylglucosamine 1-carboxyvinyltransferase [Coriobacteriia bacterium]|nr:UDP-N-acetylglucosamine 1-carboxyvinyltransferase [Coriobacteriia bacterium]